MENEKSTTEHNLEEIDGIKDFFQELNKELKKKNEIKYKAAGEAMERIQETENQLSSITPALDLKIDAQTSGVAEQWGLQNSFRTAGHPIEYVQQFYHPVDPKKREDVDFKEVSDLEYLPQFGETEFKDWPGPPNHKPFTNYSTEAIVKEEEVYSVKSLVFKKNGESKKGKLFLVEEDCHINYQLWHYWDECDGCGSTLVVNYESPQIKVKETLITSASNNQKIKAGKLLPSYLEKLKEELKRESIPSNPSFPEPGKWEPRKEGPFNFDDLNF